MTTAFASLTLGHEVVIVHGSLAKERASDLAPNAPHPVGLLGVQAQGAIGSLLVRSLCDVLPGHWVAALVTHTLVRADDPAFEQPMQLVGPLYSRKTPGALARRNHWYIARDGRGGVAWSGTGARVDPCPHPRDGHGSTSPSTGHEELAGMRRAY
ncbi:hypothetical protein [Streptomyces sp. CC224B]|uniref:hypothetical protein n=1 Tax=Streptomyces sp. CC224B TaxID=3044571 RepID=UPI0024A8F0CF|nr:hypothetical protein [Streptomyces sp. CC224B]